MGPTAGPEKFFREGLKQNPTQQMNRPQGILISRSSGMPKFVQKK